MTLTPEMVVRLRWYVCRAPPQALLHEVDADLLKAKLITLGDDFRLHLTPAGRKALEDQTCR